MRLGVVGILPADFRAITRGHLDAIKALGLTAACFHGDGEALFAVQEEECSQVKALYAEADMTLAQFGIGYKECLFDPDPAVRAHVVRKIGRGLEVGKMLGAGCCLIRTGSLAPNGGSYSPSSKNHAPECHDRLLESLQQIAEKAEAVGQNVVIETHVLTILNSPEIIVEVLDKVGSSRIGSVMDYVNHFQTLDQVYNSADRINHIFDVMEQVCPVAHCKDIAVNDGFVVHLSEAAPGEGELDLTTALRRWHAAYPDGYMLLEHLSAKPPASVGSDPVHQLGWTPLEAALYDRYAQAARHVQQLAAAAGIPID